MNPRLLAVAAGLCLAGFVTPRLAAQTATLTSSSPAYLSGGGQITLTATITYTGLTPAALGYTINLPAGWALVSTGGTNVPAASPDPGTVDMLEYAYTSFPAGQASFTATISYPAGQTGNKSITASAIYRSPLQNLTVTPISLVLAQPPSITTQPVAVTVSSGQPASFSVVASSALPVTYQWRKGASAISGATNANYSLAAATPADEAAYSVVVTNADGSVTSNSATLTVLYAPVISTQPANVIANQGQTATFTVTAVGSPAPTYVWRKGGNAITGNTSATTATLTLTAVQPGDAGSFDVVITNSQGSATSNPATLTVTLPPTFTVQPAGTTVTVGANVTLTATATGTPTPTYQWRKNSANISGATNASLSFTPTQASDAGTYDVVATNVAGTATSNPAVLVVNVPPAITTQPAGATVNAGLATFSFSVVATGSPAPTYQWMKDNANLPGATNATFTIAGVAAANAGLYKVVVANVAGSVTSNEVTLTVNVPPSITTQPASIAIGIGTNTALSVTAIGTAPLSYQWSKDGTSIPGATTSSLALTNATATTAGTYRVTVTNLAGNIVSNPASLAVVDAVPTHAVSGPGYVAGGTVTITNTLTFANTTYGLGWQVLLPTGWSYAASGSGAGDVKPAVGTTNLLEWAWTDIPASPITFTYTLNVPATASGDASLAALAVVRQSGVVAQIVAKSDPLIVSQVTNHTADTDRNFRISLLELTRVIELYNTRNGTVRTGRYLPQAGTEDGFAADPTTPNTAVVTLTSYHAADTNKDGKLSLLELTRVIELYNTRSGTTRTGQYHAQAGTEDGFAAGP